MFKMFDYVTLIIAMICEVAMIVTGAYEAVIISKVFGIGFMVAILVFMFKTLLTDTKKNK